jgi:hypothetical protein
MSENKNKKTTGKSSLPSKDKDQDVSKKPSTLELPLLGAKDD